ncbi:MAG: hypothetical protein AAF570_05375 [Bacteroidota bacterium]
MKHLSSTGEADRLYPENSPSPLQLHKHENSETGPQGIGHAARTTYPSGPIVQRRRIPGQGDPFAPQLKETFRDYTQKQGDLLPTATLSVNIGAHTAGLQRVLERAISDLKGPEKTKVLAAYSGTFPSKISEVKDSDRLLKIAEIIHKTVPRLRLASPNLINTGARPNTPDKQNIASLVKSCTTVLDQIAGGKHDRLIVQVFGKAYLNKAKAKYKNARTSLTSLHQKNKILSDRSGYYAESQTGGLTVFGQEIAVSPSVIDTVKAGL